MLMRTKGKFCKSVPYVLTVMVMFAAGCAGKKAADEGGIPNAVNADQNLMGDSDSGNAQGLQTINFGFDSFSLDKSAKDKLKGNSDIMKGAGSLRTQIEGHCDSRGGIQYNIALGEKRANAVMNYMVDLGVPRDRVTTISFGKERPLDPKESEDAWAKNRRANFVITAK